MAHVPEPRYVPADTNGGWGVAGFILLLTAACIVMATYVHHKTYLHPQDVRWHAKGEAPSADNGAPEVNSPRAPQ